MVDLVIDRRYTDTADRVQIASLSTGLLVFLLVVWSLFAHALARSHKYLTEGSAACALGLVTGLSLLTFQHWLGRNLVARLLEFDSASFFTYLLPPVIFYAGISVERKLFFSNIFSILNYGVIGTAVSFVVTSTALYGLTAAQLSLEDCLALGAIYSATDSVATLQVLDPETMPLLFSLVFGEGVINDATSVVLLGAVAHMFPHRKPPVIAPPSPSPPPMAPPFMLNASEAAAEAVFNAAEELGRLLLQAADSASVDAASSANLISGGVGNLTINGTSTGNIMNATDSDVGGLIPEGGSLLGLISGLSGSFMYLFTTSLALGAGAGIGIALLMSMRGERDARGPHHELALIGLLAYLTYLAAEVLGLSGILALFCCGLAVAQFALPNVSAAGRETTLAAFKAGSHLSEGIIFIFVGLDCLDPFKWKAAYFLEAVWLFMLMVIILLVARAAAVVPLSLLHNLWAPRRLSRRDILVIWWSGLMRGSVSVALVYLHFDTQRGRGAGSTDAERHQATLIVCTLCVVMCTILAVGAFTKPLLNLVMEEEQPLEAVREAVLSSSGAQWLNQVIDSGRRRYSRVGGEEGLPMSTLNSSGQTVDGNHNGVVDAFSSRYSAMPVTGRGGAGGGSSSSAQAGGGAVSGKGPPVGGAGGPSSFSGMSQVGGLPDLPPPSGLLRLDHAGSIVTAAAVAKAGGVVAGSTTGSSNSSKHDKIDKDRLDPGGMVSPKARSNRSQLPHVSNGSGGSNLSGMSAAAAPGGSKIARSATGADESAFSGVGVGGGYLGVGGNAAVQRPIRSVTDDGVRGGGSSPNLNPGTSLPLPGGPKQMLHHPSALGAARHGSNTPPPQDQVSPRHAP